MIEEPSAGVKELNGTARMEASVNRVRSASDAALEVIVSS